MHRPLFFLLLVLVSGIRTQDAVPAEEEAAPVTSRPALKQWESYDFPDPQVDYFACGLTAPGWVCDPGHVIPAHQREILNRKIEEIHLIGGCNKSICVQCHTTRLPSAMVLPAVAIIPDIMGYHVSDEDRLAVTRDFAYSLLDWHWKYGSHCHNDFLIAFAVEEGKVWTTVGKSAEELGLIPHCCQEVFSRHEHFFHTGNIDYGEGLMNMMEEYRRILVEDVPCEFPRKQISRAAIGGIIFAILLALFLLAAFCVYMRKGDGGGRVVEHGPEDFGLMGEGEPKGKKKEKKEQESVTKEGSKPGGAWIVAMAKLKAGGNVNKHPGGGGGGRGGKGEGWSEGGILET